MTTEILTSDERPIPPPREPRGSRRGLGMQTSALTAALSLVLVGGVVTAAYRAVGNGGTAPEKLVPASAFGFARIDLNLPGGQESAVEQFAGHFPGSPTLHGSGTVRDRLLRAMFADSSNPHVDYDSDVKPWLGDRAAIAGWTDAHGKPAVEFVLQSTDDASARTHLQPSLAKDHAGLTFSDGYAVISSSTALAEEAVADAKKSSLADDAAFRSDMGRLPDAQTATAWLDGPAVLRMMKSAMGPGFSAGPGLGMGMGMGMGVPMMGLPMFGRLGGGAQALQGRTVLGVHFEPTYADVTVRSIGGPSGSTLPSSLLTKLPNGTVAALELGDTDQLMQGLTAGLSLAMLPSSLSQRSAGVGGPTSIGVAPACPASGCGAPSRLMPALPAACPPGARSCPARPHFMPRRYAAPPKIVCLRNKPCTINGIPLRGSIPRAKLRELQRLARLHQVQPMHSYGAGPEPIPAPSDPISGLRSWTGLTLPGDARALLGDGMVAAYGGLQVGALPKVALRSRPTDLSAAQQVADKLRAALAKHGITIAVDDTDGDLVLATSEGYAQEIISGGDFAAQPQVQTALGSIPASVSAAGYVDLGTLLPLIPNVPQDVTHLKALGFWSGGSGDVQEGELRLVVG